MASATITSTPPAAEEQHFHRWRIEEPNGQLSIGTCKTCGATKEFKNWLSDGDFITNEEHRMASAA
ncbi:MAG: hypothetical protein IT301_04925 [Dehalococcoidia bacterium]|nr:hypothetical protein [Dehalococcoidia bacterium]